MSIKMMAAVWEHSRQKSGRLLLLLALADYANDEGVAWPSVESLAEKARMSERNAHYALAEMATEENPEVVIDLNAGPRGANLYFVRPGGADFAPRVQNQQGAKSSRGGAKSSRGGAKSDTKGVQPAAPEPSLNPSIEPSIEPSFTGAAAPASPPPPAPSPSKPASPRTPTRQQAEVGAWARVMGLDLGIPANAKRVGSMLTGLRKSEVCQPSVDVAESFWTIDGGVAWNYYRDTWQGQKGQPPTEREINQYWGAWLRPAVTPARNGNANARAAPTSAQAKTDEAWQIINGPLCNGHAGGVIDGKVVHGK